MDLFSGSQQYNLGLRPNSTLENMPVMGGLLKPYKQGYHDLDLNFKILQFSGPTHPIRSESRARSLFCARSMQYCSKIVSGSIVLFSWD